MASISTSASTTLARYRPALLFLTGLTAALSVYYIHSQVITSSPTPPQPLRRRNAVHRSGARRRQAGELQELLYVLAPLFQLQSYHTPLDHEEPGRSAQAVLSEQTHEDLGSFTIPSPEGRPISRPLQARYADVRAVQLDFGISAEQAQIEHQRLVAQLLDNIFLALFTRNVRLARSGPLTEELEHLGFRRGDVEDAVLRYNALAAGEDLDEYVGLSEDREPVEDPVGDEAGAAAQALDGRETVVDVDGHSEFSWRGQEEGGSTKEGQNLLSLLYHIAEEQAKREGYVHRGVTCNSCGVIPIRGIRYRCSNCIDFDLCENCEAMQIHPKTHLFYKVRIPAPFLGNPRQAQPVWYPGKPQVLPQTLPQSLSKRLVKETSFDVSEVEALYEQFKCLAATEWLEDPNHLKLAIDRRTFDKCFVPNTTIRPPPPNLLYDRMFAFYDTNNDGLIGFEEFLRGLACLRKDRGKDEDLKRVFQGYDIDGDGYIDRKDFLRMFRAFYALSKELTRDMVSGLEDDVIEGGAARDVVLGSQPISSAFTGAIPPGENSRTGEGKRRDRTGDMEIVDNGGVVRESSDDTGDRGKPVADAAERDAFPGSSTTIRPNAAAWDDALAVGTDGDVDSTVQQLVALTENPWSVTIDGDDQADDDDTIDPDTDDRWPPNYVTIADVEEALGGYMAIEDVRDFQDRRKVRDAAHQRLAAEEAKRREEVRKEALRERWRRRQFYIDEEDGAVAPEDFEKEEFDSSEDEDHEEKKPKNNTIEDEMNPPSISPTHRSRSSSKVRFEDEPTDIDFDTRSNPSTSSRSIPLGERWGGYEVPEAERDVGKEILYQVTQHGLNEMLDLLFKKKEDLAVEVQSTRAERRKWDAQINFLSKKNKGSWGKGKDIGEYKSSDPAHGLDSPPIASGALPYPSADGDVGFHPAATSTPRDISRDDSTSTSSSVLDPLILARPLDDLLREAGYSVASPMLFLNRPVLEQIEALSGPDPTLPQNRPDSVAGIPDPAGGPITDLSPSVLSLLDTQLIKRLAYLSALDPVEMEIKERGGPGKLSWKEFERIMKSDEGRRLGFVGAWIEMASF